MRTEDIFLNDSLTTSTKLKPHINFEPTIYLEDQVDKNVIQLFQRQKSATKPEVYSGDLLS